MYFGMYVRLNAKSDEFPMGWLKFSFCAETGLGQICNATCCLKIGYVCWGESVGAAGVLVLQC